MKALMRHGPKVFKTVEIDKPVAEAGEVIIKVKATGICGSDIVRGLDDNEKWDKLVLGHEFSGVIDELGEGVQGWEVGQPVSAAPLCPDHDDEWSKKGLYSLCKNYSFIGSRKNGSFAEYVKVPAENLVKLPEGFDFEKGALLEPITVCLHPIMRLDNLLGKSVVVTGAGPIGLLAVQIFKAMGVKDLIVSDVVDEKLELAVTYGATKTINPINESLEDYCAALPGQGVDITFESSGALPAKKSAISVTKGRGSVLLVGTSHADVNFEAAHFEQVTRKELNLVGSWMNYSAPFPGPEWDTAAWMLEAGLITGEGLVTHRFNLDDAPKGFDVIYNREPFTKILFVPEEA